MNEVLLPRIDGEIEQSASFGIGALATAQGNLPMCGLGYQTVIRGLAVRTEITQTFYNPFDQPIEATYVFPIEGTMAVTDCLMMVGDRIIRADLQERAAARQRYKDAIRRGHRAALLEENRSETFSLSVGNIPPGEAIRIRMITVGQLAVVNSIWTLRLPLVVAPRYTSGFEIPDLATGSGTTMDTDEVPDASHVTPPVFLPGSKNRVDLSLSVDIDLEALKPATSWNQHLSSSLHSVVLDGDENRCRVQIKPGNRIDRDFILRGSVASQRLTTSARLEPSVSNQRGTFAIDLMPPQIVESEKRGRDVVFVLDRSGSMGGWKYVAAQRGIARLIDSLNERDRFGVIAFDDQQLFFVEPSGAQPRNSYREVAMGGACLVTATDKNRFAAIKWMNNIAVNGGTEMAPAIEMALDMVAIDGRAGSKASIVLITDGHITGEDFVLSRLHRVDANRRPRIYTLGVDRAVNASVLRRLSTATGGTFELVESESQLDKSLRVMAQEMGSPVLTDIRIQSAEEFELVIGSADLYANRPVSIYGRTALSELTVRLLANDANGKPWEQDVRVLANDSTPGTLISLWGKGRVRMLEDQYAINGVDNEAARQKIVDTSIESRVLSRFTAYVAVDETEVVNKTGSVVRVVQPVELPEGWQTRRFPAIPPTLRICTRDSATIAENSMFCTVDGESADSILREFSDRAVDFFETEIEPSYFMIGMDDDFAMSDTFGVSTKDEASLRFGMVGSSGSTRSRKSGVPAIGSGSGAGDNLPLLQIIQHLFAEASQLRSTKIILQKTGDSVLVQHLIDGVLHERDRLPLQMWCAIVKLLKSLPATHTERDNVWEGEFSPSDSAEYQRMVTFGTQLTMKQKMMIRIEADDKIEIIF